MSADAGQINSKASLPQWMKNKSVSATRFDLDENTFSPPSHDDSFFYIRYPSKSTSAVAKDGFQDISDVLRNRPPAGAASGQKQNPASATSVDFSKHTKPCQQYMAGTKATAPVSSKPVKGQVKSNGTDDGFDGKGAACGSSIVRMAQAIVAQNTPNTLSRVTTVGNIEQDEEFERSAVGYDRSKRRPSKSLPASPLGSPKIQRRPPPNPYFTGNFHAPNSNQVDQPSRGWILSGLLGQRSELYTSQTIVDELDETQHQTDNYDSSINIKKSVENINIFEDEDVDKRQSQLFRAKPSELREMNFWSPTSM